MKNDAINPLDDIIEVLSKNDKVLTDIVFATDGEQDCLKDAFVNQVNGLTYCDKFNAEGIYADLKIVGRGWWLERYENCWVFKTTPKRNIHRASPNVKIWEWEYDD